MSTSIFLNEPISGRPSLTYTSRTPSPARHSLPSEFSEFFVRKNLATFEKLEADWDGEGALPVHPETLINAYLAIDAMSDAMAFAESFPNPNGTISFAWESRRGRSELEIGKTSFSFFINPRSGRTLLTDGNVASLTSPSYVDQLVQSLFMTLYPENSISSAVSSTYAAHDNSYALAA